MAGVTHPRNGDTTTQGAGGVTEPALRLFCLPYAGGRASLFWDWQEALPAGVDVRAIEYPGRGERRREPLRVDVRELVEDAIHVVRACLDRPIALFGHSLGASVAFELARRLAAERGIEPVRLYLSGRRAPQLPEPRPSTYALPEPEFVACLRRLNGTPEAVLAHDALLRLMLPILRADFRAAQTYAYRPGHRLSAPIVALGGLGDEEVGASELDAWREHTSGPFLRAMLPGDHFFLHTSRAALLSWLAADLRDVIARARQAPVA